MNHSKHSTAAPRASTTEAHHDAGPPARKLANGRSGEAPPAPALGPAEREEPAVRVPARGLGVSPAVSPAPAGAGIGRDPQLVAGVGVPVPGDHQSPLSPDDAHAALAELVASWGLGGALAELQQLSARHGGLPTEAEQVLAPLSMLVGAYATTGSTSATSAWRSAPCLLCAAEVAL